MKKKHKRATLASSLNDTLGVRTADSINNNVKNIKKVLKSTCSLMSSNVLDAVLDEEDCNQAAIKGAGYTKGSNGPPRKSYPNEEGSSIADTTVFVLVPAEASFTAVNCEDGIRPTWLLWLAITLVVLFLIMLLMNIFLCTAMSCSCANTEIIEKEPSIIEEYDPYRCWHGNQYGSLHGPEAHKCYTSGGSTTHSNRSDRY